MNQFILFLIIQCLFLFVDCQQSQHIDIAEVAKSKIEYKNIDGGAWKQGWPVTYDLNEWTQEDPLKVFVMPHSHVDAGWLMTFDEYYQKQTKGIISSVVTSLFKDERRHFLWADIGFFQRWWDESTMPMREKVKKIVERGQFEFVTGAWVTSDEANPRYNEMLEQILEGHEWLKKHLGVKPRFGWSIDPFGHSPSMAYLLARCGFDAIIINRVHYEIKKELAQRKSLEFYWKQSWDKSDAPQSFFTEPFGSTEILTHMFPFYSYDVPHTCGPEPAICCEFDFARGSCPWAGHRPTPINEQNLRTQAEKLLDQYRKKSQLFRTKSVLIPVGDDFRYKTESECNLMFDNYQKIFDYINSHPEYNAVVQFSNLTSYFESVKQSVRGDRTAIPTLTGDFFTYADRDKDYWSGYFTSRPFYKALGRRTQATLRAAEILHSLVHVRGDIAEPQTLRGQLLDARRALGIYQHHDAVTGTAKQHVNDDYGHMLHSARHGMRATMRALLDAALRGKNGGAEPWLLPVEDSQRPPNSLPLHLSMPLDNQNSRAVLIWNPLPEARTTLASVAVDRPDVFVRDSLNRRPLQQLMPNWHDADEADAAPFRLFFAAELPALGYAPFFVSAGIDSPIGNAARANIQYSGTLWGRFASTSALNDFETNQTTSGAASLGDNGYVQVDANGFVFQIGQETIKESIGTYATVARGSSGMYLIDPNLSRWTTLRSSSIIISKGVLFEECRVKIEGINMERVLRVPTRQALHMNMFGGPASPYVDIIHRVHLTQPDRELAARWDASSMLTDTKREFYGDANGFQWIKRTYDNRLPASANFFPVTSMAFMQSSTANERFSVALAQSHAAGSPGDGSVEFILDRRTAADDNRGVGQALNDNLRSELKSRIFIEKSIVNVRTHPSSSGSSIHRSLEHPTHQFYSSASAPKTPASWLKATTHDQSAGVETHDRPGRSLLVDVWPKNTVLETLRVADEDESELLLYVRNTQEVSPRRPLSLSSSVFAGLTPRTSSKWTLSMQREDTRYRHGDEVGVRPLELECYKIALQLDTDTSNAAQTKEEKKVVEKQVVNNDGGKPLSRSMSRKGLEKAYKEQVAKVEQLEMLLARDANDQEEFEAQLDDLQEKAIKARSADINNRRDGFLFYAVPAAGLLLQAIIAIFSFEQSKVKSIILGIIFLITLLWVQVLVLHTVHH